MLKSFIDLFNENSRHVVKKLQLEGGKSFDAHDYMSEATVEILLGECCNLDAIANVEHTHTNVCHVASNYAVTERIAQITILLAEW